jgi:beta-glucanase (GH16 family)
MARVRIVQIAAAAALGLALCACLRPAAPAQAAATASGPLKSAPDGRTLALAFDDEFDSWRPYRHGQGVWRTWFRDGTGEPLTERTLAGNKELQLYVDPDWAPDGGPPIGLDPFSVHDGVLEIAAQPAPERLRERLSGYRYVSGLISSQPSFRQLYGYFEMRARLPRGKGVWPAFWLLPADLEWPPEIDVMESVGDPAKIYVTAHSKVDKAVGTEVPVSGDGFHTYAVAWDARQLVWYVDGREVRRQPTPPDMHKPMYVLANVALGGDWAGPPDASTPWPARMGIDYIRAYRFAP